MADPGYGSQDGRPSPKPTSVNGGNPAEYSEDYPGVDGALTKGQMNDFITHTTFQTKDVEDKVSFCKLFKDNAIYVMTYCCVFGSFGVCVGFLGPTVFDLGCQTSSDQKEMNWW